jgi:hypothetical protein
MDVVAFNHHADTIYDFDGDRGEFARNLVWRSFMDPRRRRLYVAWDHTMRLAVGLFRSMYASQVGDPAIEKLLGALQQSSPEFCQIWAEHNTAPLDTSLPPWDLTASMQLDVPKLGRLAIHSMRLLLPSPGGFVLFILAPADARAAAAFDATARRLARRQIREARKPAPVRRASGRRGEARR